ncbi:hypothetical protein [Tsukamurella paurometabola]|uniref:Uncharacterized protein n=1 Tax=Tsukamurella paurometabola TaxID=2061 RepID=A0ABS5N728_TSUPA|nr:hypothetical protein [Tsukamurella paurometabola]MBS4100082.1 hypothetical protein [Tsukamurella paurometabola]
MGTWEDLQRTPIADVRRRAAIVDTWNGIEPVDVPGGVRFAWNDGGGQAAGWFFADDGRVLLLTYEHESVLNFYEDYASQLSVFGGVPDALVAIVADRPESYEFLNTENDQGRTLPHASGVFWFDGARWQIAQGLVEYCATHDITLIADGVFSHDVGFEYALGDCRFGEEFTPEALIAEQVANGYYEEPGEEEAALGALRAVFAAYDRAPR